MVRPIGILAGLGFVTALLFAVFFTSHDPAQVTAASVFHKEPKDVSFSFDGPFGKYDQRQLQRGLKVYKEVCSACHSMKLVSFRDFADLGYTPGQIKALAADWQTEVPSINPDTGEPATRKALPSDTIPPTYANETAARAGNNNALPPDMSLLAKAREGGSHYIYSIVTGYADVAGYKNDKGEELLKKFPDFTVPDNLHFNPYFANLNIAMPPPLVADGQVEYDDGTPSTVDQNAKDVAAFLMWVAEPKLENRHRMGIAVVIFLLIGTTLAYLSYRNIWHPRSKN